MPKSLKDLERSRSVEELASHIALLALMEVQADGAEVWIRNPDGKLRTVEGPGTAVEPDSLGLARLPAQGDADSAPGSWRGRLMWRAVDLVWGDSHPGVLVLGYAEKPPALEALERDLTGRIPIWSLALDRMIARSQAAQVDAEASARIGAGLAHTLSNVLQAAISSTESARARTSVAPALVNGKAPLEDALDALRRAANLVQQLGAVGGQAGEISKVEIRSLTAGLAAALRRQMPAGIDLVLDACENESWVLADRAALEATVASVVYIAREALGSSGAIHMAAREEHDLETGQRTAVIEVKRRADYVGAPTPLPGRVPLTPDNKGGDTDGASRLGLSFARAVLLKYGGTVTEAMLPSGGMAVILRLPQVQLATRHTISGMRRMQPRGVSRVLLADDDPAVLRGVARVLEAAGHEVLSAHDGAEALSIARTNKGLTVALIDLTMPRLAGPALVAALRRVAPSTPVVVMTGYASDEMVEALRHEGALCVLRKPIEAQALLAVLSDAVDAAATG